jgi:hypothetical protein
MTIRTLLLGFLLGIFTSSAVVYATYPVIGYRWATQTWEDYVKTHPEEAKSDLAGALFNCQIKLNEKKDL